MEHHGAHGPTSWLLQIPGLPHDPHLVHINGALVVLAFITVCCVLANLKIRKGFDKLMIPDAKPTFAGTMDVLMEGLHGMICDTLGHSGEKYFPFIASLFLFILLSNFLGLLPHSSAPTASVSTNLALGLSAFVYYNVQGVREHGIVGYMKDFLMGLGPAGVLIALLEVVSHCIRPLSLTIRLFVNMFVDHTVVLSFQSLCIWLLPVPLLLLGIIVSTIQAFVFATLTAVYVQMATEHEH